MTKVTVEQGEIIKVSDNKGSPFEGQVQVPNLENKDHSKMTQTLVRIKPEVLERRELAEFLTTTVEDADMVVIHDLINPLYNALRSISKQVNIDRDAKAEEEVYKFLNSIRTNLETLYENKS